MLPPNVYLTDIAERWGMEEGEALRLLIGRNVVCTLLENVKRVVCPQAYLVEAVGRGQSFDWDNFRDFVRIHVGNEYLEIISKQGFWEGHAIYHEFHWYEREELYQDAAVIDHDGKTSIKITLKDLYVTSRNLLPLEKELCLGPEKNSAILDSMPFLREDHDFHADELAIAVRAWLHLYEENPPQDTPKRGHKEYIRKWLKTNYPKLRNKTRERIAIVVNPDHRSTPVSRDFL